MWLIMMRSKQNPSHNDQKLLNCSVAGDLSGWTFWETILINQAFREVFFHFYDAQKLRQMILIFYDLVFTADNA